MTRRFTMNALRIRTNRKQDLKQWKQTQPPVADRARGLILNLAKTKIVILGSFPDISDTKLDRLPIISIADYALPYVSEAKTLGLTISSALSWQSQVSMIRKENTRWSTTVKPYRGTFGNILFEAWFSPILISRPPLLQVQMKRSILSFIVREICVCAICRWQHFPSSSREALQNHAQLAFSLEATRIYRGHSGLYCSIAHIIHLYTKIFFLVTS